MHVRSSGDLVEITGERDSLAISCDLSEVHSCNHTYSGYAHEHVQTRQFKFIVRILLQGLRRGGRLSGDKILAHEFINFCMTV
jgi:hypothetical protein